MSQENVEIVATLVDAWNQPNVEMLALFDPECEVIVRDQAVISWRFSGQGKQSGAAVELTLTTVSSLRDEKIARIRNHPRKPKPSKPPAYGSRGCRRGTWSSFAVREHSRRNFVLQ